jgi:hypothetical protein
MGSVSRVSNERRALPNAVKVGRPPIWLVAIAALTTLWNVGMAYGGALSTGISWDERVHGLMLQAWMDTGRYWLADFDEVPMRFIYGPVGDLIGHIFALAAREDGLGSVGFSAGAFAARHVAAVTVSVAGVAGVVLLTRCLLSSWRWAVIAAAVLTSIPMWTGHAMFNMKDVAVATGYTWATLGLVLMSSPLGVVGASRRLFYGVCAFSLGAVLALGTRTAMWLPLVVSVGAMLALALLVSWRRSSWGRAWHETLARLAGVLAALVVSYATLLLVYREVWGPPFSGAVTAVTQSTDFELWKEPTPWTYIPNWFGHQLPLLILGFGVVGAVLSIAIAVRAISRHGTGGEGTAVPPTVALVVMQLALMPIAAIALRSPLYDGVRHFLLVLPALAVLATLAMRSMDGLAFARARWLGVGAGIVIAFSILVPTLEQSRLFPYNYTYFNALTSIRPINGEWPTDYWRTSWRELAGLLPNNDLAVCPPRMVFKEDVAPNWPRVDTYSCRFEYMVSPYLSPDQAGGAVNRSETEYWILRENYSGYYVPTNCEVYDEVSRPLRGQDANMSYLLKCRYKPGDPIS